MGMSKVIARAWADPGYKAKLLSDPHAALAEAGVTIPAGTKLKVVENTADTMHVVLPAAPSSVDELTEEELGKVAAGSGVACQVCTTMPDPWP
jgi:Nitrile hydratase, alpha chain